MSATKRFTIGDTVRLEGTFYNFAGALADPDSITVRIYDARRQQLHEAELVLVDARVSLGVFQYDYTIPATVHVRDGLLFYEFAGMLGGTPSVERAILPLQWSTPL